MIRRFGRKDALISFIKPAIIYLGIATIFLYLFHGALLDLKGGMLVGVAILGIWRYGLLIINYTRAFIYSKFKYPSYLKQIQEIDFKDRFPKKIYFVIPSYKEDYWVTTEVFQSLIEEINSIPSKAVLVVSTSSEYENSIVMNVFNAHANADKIDIIFQTQSMGKRIAMGHALRVVAREYNKMSYEDENSVTLFMDGDTYIPANTLSKALPFFKIDNNLGAVTTNEIGYIESESKWYKDWFNLKFAQRHLLFQSHSLSKRVLTLTGRFSLFRTSAVISEEFISLIENDIIVDSNYGKFRFLMGDDKSSWYYMMKNNWNLLYLPDVIAYSLESRDGDFLEISRTLPYRWYGNTLRNNKRARALKNQPLFIKYLFYDQLALMWTSTAGILSVIFLSIFKSIYYIPLYISWILYVRVFQMGVFSLLGHRVSLRTLPLMLYGQWYGSYVKIRAFFNLSDQKWSKAGGEVQTADDDTVPLDFKYSKHYQSYKMYLFISMFIFIIFTFQTHILKLPHLNLLNYSFYTKHDNAIYFEDFKQDQKDDAKVLNKIIKNAVDGSTIFLPKGILDIYTPIVINRDHINIVGNHTTLLSHMQNNEKAVIVIEGKKLGNIGQLRSSMFGKVKIDVKLNKEIQKDDLLLIEEENTKEFVFGVLGSKRWYKKYPLLRSEIIKVKYFKDDKVVMQYLSKSYIDTGARISKIDPIKDVKLKNIKIDSIYKADKYKHVYKNIKENLHIDGIYIKYAEYININNVSIYNSGSSPLVFERSYNCYGNDIYIDGAVNKGKKGNGYLRFNKSFHISLKGVSVQNIRHITFQWASAYNTIDGLYSEVDINFHGGATHDNTVKNVSFNVSDKHKWGKIYITPDNARWAPPDFDTNIVEEEI